MTFNEIQSALAAAGKPVKEAQLYRYFRNFKIQQVGIRQKPRRYADDSAQIILAKLGLAAAPALGTKKGGRGGRNQHGPAEHVAGVTDAAEFEKSLARVIEVAAVSSHFAGVAAERAAVASAGLMSARSRVPIPVKPAGLVKLPALKRARALAKKGAAK